MIGNQIGFIGIRSYAMVHSDASWTIAGRGSEYSISVAERPHLERTPLHPSVDLLPRTKYRVASRHLQIRVRPNAPWHQPTQRSSLECPPLMMGCAL